MEVEAVASRATVPRKPLLLAADSSAEIQAIRVKTPVVLPTDQGLRNRQLEV
jgi:hypothetical protein